VDIVWLALSAVGIDRPHCHLSVVATKLVLAERIKSRSGRCFIFSKQGGLMSLCACISLLGLPGGDTCLLFRVSSYSMHAERILSFNFADLRIGV
jgi:hypothetical protein